MRRIFVDSSFLIALFDDRDQWHSAAAERYASLRGVQLVTTDGVITEFLAHISRRRNEMRLVAVRQVQRWRRSEDQSVVVVRQSDDHFERGLALFGARADKSYSLVDCIAMIVMDDMGVREVLTFDIDFRQAGYVVLP